MIEDNKDNQKKDKTKIKKFIFFLDACLIERDPQHTTSIGRPLAN